MQLSKESRNRAFMFSVILWKKKKRFILKEINIFFLFQFKSKKYIFSDKARSDNIYEYSYRILPNIPSQLSSMNTNSSVIFLLFSSIYSNFSYSPYISYNKAYGCTGVLLLYVHSFGNVRERFIRRSIYLNSLNEELFSFFFFFKVDVCCRPYRIHRRGARY